jgi:hypothetical protein
MKKAQIIKNADKMLKIFKKIMSGTYKILKNFIQN